MNTMSPECKFRARALFHHHLERDETRVFSGKVTCARVCVCVRLPEASASIISRSRSLQVIRSFARSLVVMSSQFADARDATREFVR